MVFTEHKTPEYGPIKTSANRIVYTINALNRRVHPNAEVKGKSAFIKSIEVHANPELYIPIPWQFKEIKEGENSFEIPLKDPDAALNRDGTVDLYGTSWDAPSKDERTNPHGFTIFHLKGDAPQGPYSLKQPVRFINNDGSPYDPGLNTGAPSVRCNSSGNIEMVMQETYDDIEPGTRTRLKKYISVDEDHALFEYIEDIKTSDEDTVIYDASLNWKGDETSVDYVEYNSGNRKKGGVSTSFHRVGQNTETTLLKREDDPTTGNSWDIGNTLEWKGPEAIQSIRLPTQETLVAETAEQPELLTHTLFLPTTDGKHRQSLGITLKYADINIPAGLFIKPSDIATDIIEVGHHSFLKDQESGDLFIDQEGNIHLYLQARTDSPTEEDAWKLYHAHCDYNKFIEGIRKQLEKYKRLYFELSEHDPYAV
jgi:hypothetical protein